MEEKFQVQDNPFLGVTLTTNLTPNLGSNLLLKKSPFYSQSEVKILNSEMGLFYSLHGLFLLFLKLI